jgi:hypothetical protein
MTLQEMLKAVDELPWEDLEKLQERINARRQRQALPPYSSRQQMMDEINRILQSAEPVELMAGTMDVDRLAVAVAAMRAGLTEAQLDDMVKAMNEEFIAPGEFVY